MPEKRKTNTSTDVKRRYNERVYARLSLSLPKELVADFRAAAQEQGVSVTSVLKKAMENYIAEFPPKNE